MSTKINPYLVARLHAIESAFKTSGGKSPSTISNYNKPKIIAKPKQAKDWRDLLKEGDNEGEGDGGGTQKGLRGKDTVYAKMRRLSRGR